MKQVRDGPGWATHYACCEPINPDQLERGKYQYCRRHWPFQSTGTAKELVRSLRKHL